MGNKESEGPIIYVAGKVEKLGKKDIQLGGFGVHWANDEANNQCARFSQIPITLYRAQLSAILFALRQVSLILFISFLLTFLGKATPQ